MPYEGEFAGYRALQRITETERVQQLLRRAQVYTPGASGPAITPSVPPAAPEQLPGVHRGHRWRQPRGRGQRPGTPAHKWDISRSPAYS